MIRIKRGMKFSSRELKLGIPVEFEHTRSRKIATRIAKQHLVEFPNYYSKGLLPMERRLAKLNKRRTK